MELIKLPTLRNHELQAITEEIIKICEPAPELTPAVTNIKAVLEPFKEGMLKEQSTALDKKKSDYNRDQVAKGFIKAVRNELLFPHTDKLVIETLKELNSIVNKYGTEITRLPLNIETAALDNLLSEVSDVDFSKLKETGLERWITEIKSANEQFKQAAREYNQDITEFSSILSATVIAPELKKVVNGLFAILFGQIMIAPNDELIKLNQQLENLVESY